MAEEAQLDPLARRAGLSSDGPALIEALTGQTIVWAELHERAEALAAALAQRGAGPGRRVGLRDASPVSVAVALHACLRIGSALVLLDPRGTTGDVERQERAAQPDLILAAGDFAANERPSTPLGEAPRQFEAANDAVVIFTSGSSGEPKAVRLTAANCTASAEGCAEALHGTSADDRWLLALGTHRVGGLAILWRSVESGAAVVHLDRFSEAGVAAALERRPSLASLVPAMLHRLLAAGLLDYLRGPRAILLGGGPVDRADVRSWAAAGLAVCPSYGMTETGSQVAVVPPGSAAELAGAAGLAHSHAIVEVDAGDGETGEILVGGAVLSPGYLDPGVGRFSGEGGDRRLRTGDLGSLGDGVLTVAGRLDRLIVTGGEKVSPEEVEAVLREHPGVHDALVQGAPDPIYGLIVTASVVGEADPADLQTWCRDHLAPHKLPRRIERVEALPRGEDGKLRMRPS